MSLFCFQDFQYKKKQQKKIGIDIEQANICHCICYSRQLIVGSKSTDLKLFPSLIQVTDSNERAKKQRKEKSNFGIWFWTWQIQDTFRPYRWRFSAGGQTFLKSKNLKVIFSQVIKLKPPEGPSPDNTLTLAQIYFRPLCPELQENRFVLFQSPKLMIICYSSSRKPIQAVIVESKNECGGQLQEGRRSNTFHRERRIKSRDRLG